MCGASTKMSALQTDGLYSLSAEALTHVVRKEPCSQSLYNLCRSGKETNTVCKNEGVFERCDDFSGVTALLSMKRRVKELEQSLLQELHQKWTPDRIAEMQARLLRLPVDFDRSKHYLESKRYSLHAELEPDGGEMGLTAENYISCHVTPDTVESVRQWNFYTVYIRGERVIDLNGDETNKAIKVRRYDSKNLKDALMALADAVKSDKTVKFKTHPSDTSNAGKFTNLMRYLLRQGWPLDDESSSWMRVIRFIN